jgi:hypothetical protein
MWDELCSSYDSVQIFMVLCCLWGCGKVFSEIIFVAYNSLSLVSLVSFRNSARVILFGPGMPANLSRLRWLLYLTVAMRI